MLSWAAVYAAVAVACSAFAVGRAAPSAAAAAEAGMPLEDRIMDYLRNGYSRQQRTTEDMFLRCDPTATEGVPKRANCPYTVGDSCRAPGLG